MDCFRNFHLMDLKVTINRIWYMNEDDIFVFKCCKCKRKYSNLKDNRYIVDMGWRVSKERRTFCFCEKCIVKLTYKKLVLFCYEINDKRQMNGEYDELNNDNGSIILINEDESNNLDN